MAFPILCTRSWRVSWLIFDKKTSPRMSWKFLTQTNWSELSEFYPGSGFTNVSCSYIFCPSSPKSVEHHSPWRCYGEDARCPQPSAKHSWQCDFQRCVCPSHRAYAVAWLSLQFLAFLSWSSLSVTSFYRISSCALIRTASSLQHLVGHMFLVQSPMNN